MMVEVHHWRNQFLEAGLYVTKLKRVSNWIVQETCLRAVISLWNLLGLNHKNSRIEFKWKCISFRIMMKDDTMIFVAFCFRLLGCSLLFFGQSLILSCHLFSLFWRELIFPLVAESSWYYVTHTHTHTHIISSSFLRYWAASTLRIWSVWDLRIRLAILEITCTYIFLLALKCR